VFMKHFDRIDLSDLGSNRVTVGAGVRMIDLKNELKKHGMQLPVVPEIGNATAGAVACCGTKDSSLGPEGRGQISSTVVSLRMVNADGQDVHVVDPEELRLIRSSYGLLGIIHEVTFEVEKRTRVRYRYKRIKLDRWLKSGDPLPEPGSAVILGKAHGFLGFLLPYRRELIIERRRRLRHRRVIPFWTNPWDRMRLWMRTFAWTTGARPFNAPLRLLPFRMRRLVMNFWIWCLDHGFLKMFFLRIVCGLASYRADAMIDFKRPVSSYFDFTFWAFPVSTWGKVVPLYFEFCERFRRERHFRPGLPTEVYFIRKDDAALLSFSFDEDIYTLDMVNWSDEEPASWQAMNRAFNEFAAQHGGRPLLNQTKHLLPHVAQAVWTPGWYALARARRALDPQGRFLTPFLEGLLP
jgi:L-gulonolactone oxidase